LSEPVTLVPVPRRWRTKQAANAEARQAGAALIKPGRPAAREPRKPLILVNNRLEENARNTLAARLELAD